MMKMFLMMMMVTFSLFMFFLNHPLSMGLMILTQTFLVCLLSGFMLYSYWFSYILFLTFLGGLLVLFIYVSSIASNELFNMSLNLKLYLIFFMVISFMISMMNMNNLKFMNFNFNLEMSNFFHNYLFFNNENKFNLNKLYNNQTFFLMMMLIIYLFITLIAVIKITNIFYGPLRSSFN